jgi:ATP-binding cassette subfamily B protein
MVKKENKINTFKNNLFMLKLIWRIKPQRVLIDIFVSLLRYFSWVFYSVIFIRYLFNNGGENKNFSQISIFILISLVIFCIVEMFLSWYMSYFRPLSDQKLYYELNNELFIKAAEIDLACYENPDFYDIYTKATSEVTNRATSVLDSISETISSTISAIYVLYTMFTIDKYVVLFIIFPVIGNFVFRKAAERINLKHYNDDIPNERCQNYINRVFFLKDYAKDLRLSNIFSVLKKTYFNGYDGLMFNIKKYSFKEGILNFIQSEFLYPIVFEGTWLYAAYRAMVSKSMLIGDFVILTSAIVSSTWMIINFTSATINIFKNALYIQNLKTFLNYKSKIVDKKDALDMPDKFQSLELVNLYFTYDGQKIPVIKNINLNITNQQKIALVGHNGSGKTTLVKLILRLYEPTDGEIKLNGINIKEYKIKEYRKFFANIFQDFQLLSMSILENTVMDDIVGNEMREKAIQALEKSGIYEKVMSLKNKGDTILTREFDDEGTLLSGGENQKIAIARLFAKDSKFAIFDEPSSALDPISEYNIYKSMAEACIDKTVIFISHRLSSTQMADVVYLLEDGNIVEQGSHYELMINNGKYADFFNKQAKSYVEV